MKRKIRWDDIMDFKLKDNPIIFDLGGYKGDWANECLNRYNNPTIYIFEPVSIFYDQIKIRYESEPNIKVFNFGLSSENKTIDISINGDKSSVFVDLENKEKIVIKDIIEFIKEEKISAVDLIKINIEGEEYNLLEYLSDTPELLIFKNYLIQFHPFVVNYAERKVNISLKLSNHFNSVFNFEMIWEGWTIKN